MRRQGGPAFSLQPLGHAFGGDAAAHGQMLKGGRAMTSCRSVGVVEAPRRGDRPTSARVGPSGESEEQ
eukprot:1385326-Alexandrium_andersonii.AAC.1